MKFLLDTNAVIAIIANDRGVVSRLSDFRPADFGVSSIVMHELYFGAWNSVRVEENVARLNALRFEVLDLSVRDAIAAARIRADLKRRGVPIGPYDLLIAGQAAARSLTLITRNVREFSRVNGLQFEDWQI